MHFYHLTPTHRECVFTSGKSNTLRVSLQEIHSTNRAAEKAKGVTFAECTLPSLRHTPPSPLSLSHISQRRAPVSLLYRCQTEGDGRSSTHTIKATVREQPRNRRGNSSLLSFRVWWILQPTFVVGIAACVGMFRNTAAPRESAVI